MMTTMVLRMVRMVLIIVQGEHGQHGARSMIPIATLQTFVHDVVMQTLRHCRQMKDKEDKDLTLRIVVRTHRPRSMFEWMVR